VDPIGFAGGDVNLYGYVGNGPVNLGDPVGLEFKDRMDRLVGQLGVATKPIASQLSSVVNGKSLPGWEIFVYPINNIYIYARAER
jgi:uncharacterized protein RhaS with RHS repeats